MEFLMTEINAERLEIALVDLVAKNPDGTPVYPKGPGYLHWVNGETHTWCCMGALSDIADKRGWVELDREMVTDLVTHEVFDGSYQEVFCDQVISAYGFEDNNPYLKKSLYAGEWNDHGPLGEDGGSPPEEDFTAIAEAFRSKYLP